VQIATTNSIYTLSSVSFQKHNQDDPFIYIITTENKYTSPNAITFLLITLLLLIKDILLLFKSSKGTYKYSYKRTR
jgi:hypothetical protein